MVRPGHKTALAFRADVSWLIDTLAESIVGKNPHHVISGPAWAIKHRIVINYIETYVLENKDLPSGIHFIRKFKGRPNAYPGPIGDRGFVNFDNY